MAENSPAPRRRIDPDARFKTNRRCPECGRSCQLQFGAFLRVAALRLPPDVELVHLNCHSPSCWAPYSLRARDVGLEARPVVPSRGPG